ncbi:MAG: TIGR03668 family PPOX class F420-dependent oxidoreductase [Chloroflexi bacterium]|nr:TIGR03668 family PPOX class F420-dependent oxidoreductase [Chloroflexota bacterium]MBI3733783.1 TIGR03668 family PPOX class F420-dependent oxidoreductase [Chloroflexota bacterium]
MNVQAFIAEHRVARLATVSVDGKPHLVPVVYVYDGARLFIALDDKPKRVPPMQLKRVRNIEADPTVSLIVDDYSEDWGQLAWVRIDGIARIIQRGRVHTQAIRLLREKYPQYELAKLEDRPVIQISVKRIAHWEHTPERHEP